MKNNSFQEIWDKLKDCKKVALSLHGRPDGDSLGSCTAMKYLLERDLDCSVTLVSYDPVEENLSRMPMAKDVQWGKDFSDLDLGEYDAVLFLDQSNAHKNYSVKLKEEFVVPDGLFTIVLDHHATNTGFSSDLFYVDANAPSACSVVLDFFRAVKIKFDHDLCLRLLLGLCTDTGFFSYDASPIKALQNALFLIEQGKIDYYKEILLPVKMSIPLKTKKLQALVVNNTIVDHKLRLAYSTISAADVKKLGLNGAEVRGGIFAIQDLADVDFTFTLTELDGQIKGSFRSARNVDVSRFAVALGGGGHKPAAAFLLELMPLNEAVAKVLRVIREVGVHPIHQ